MYRRLSVRFMPGNFPMAVLSIGRGMPSQTNGSVHIPECSWHWHKKRDMPSIQTYWISGNTSNVQQPRTGVCHRMQTAGNYGSRSWCKPSAYTRWHWPVCRSTELWTEWRNSKDYLFKPNGDWQPPTHWQEKWNQPRNWHIRQQPVSLPILQWTLFTVRPTGMKQWFWKH